MPQITSRKRKTPNHQEPALLRWIAIKLDLPVRIALQSLTVSDFLKSQTRIPFEPSEATPIPLAVLPAWEERIISDQSSLPQFFHPGMLPHCNNGITAFPRFNSDKTRITQHPKSYTSWHLLAHKNLSLRPPWGVCCLGITTRPSMKHGVFRFLEAVQIGIDQSRDHWGTPWGPDFLLPSWNRFNPLLITSFLPSCTCFNPFLPQCNWLAKALLTPEQAKHLSTHSMKSTSLAAAGQLNLNLEQRAKQGHNKKSVQLYLRVDVWPSLFLQRDILVDISAGRRPLTSQERGARQPLPEPPFYAPPFTPSDLQLIQMLPPKENPNKSSQEPVPPTTPQASLSDSDEDDSSTTSSSDSSSLSEEAETHSISSSLLVINDKSHVIHAARGTNPDSSKRSCFRARNTTFEVNWGSSVLGALIQFIDEIPVGARVCQRKACLAAIDHFLK